MQSYLSVAALVSDDLYAADMKKDGIDISQYIHRPDGISLPGFRHGIDYDLQFEGHTHSPGQYAPSTGHYSISGGKFRGKGEVAEVRYYPREEAPPFSLYFHVLVVSRTAHSFIWRIGISSFSTTVLEA